jgi:hypothetical protein
MKFLIESLTDLDAKFKHLGGPGLLIFRGDPVEIFSKLSQKLGINKLCFEQDCEPIWSERDQRVAKMCSELDIMMVEKISHTLWNPAEVIKVNGGMYNFKPTTQLHRVHRIHFFSFSLRSSSTDISNVFAHCQRYAKASETVSDTRFLKRLFRNDSTQFA